MDLLSFGASQTLLNKKTSNTLTAVNTNFATPTIDSNLFNVATAIIGKTLGSLGTVESATSSDAVSDWIPIGDHIGQTIYLGVNGQIITPYRVCVYDSNKTFLRKYDYPQNFELIHGDAYIKVAQYSIASRLAKTQVNIGAIRPFTDYNQNNYVLDGETSSAQIILPAKLIAVVGHEFNIYTANVVDCDNINDFDCRWSASGIGMQQLSECLRFTPDAGDIGNYTLTLNLYKNGTLYKTASTTLHVIADGTLTNKKAVFIGDSITNLGYYPKEVVTMCGGGLTSLGTRTSQTTNHEGRPSWSTGNYVNNDTFGGLTNAFWNPSTSEFDFAYYVTQQTYTGITDVIFALGTNDTWQSTTEQTIANLNEMIASVHAHDSNIKIGIGLISPPCANQDGWGKNNGTGTQSKKAKREFIQLVNRFISEYEDKVNIDVVPFYINVDAVNDFPYVDEALSSRNPTLISRGQENVHPNQYGQLKIADVIYNYLIYHNA